MVRNGRQVTASLQLAVPSCVLSGCPYAHLSDPYNIGRLSKAQISLTAICSFAFDVFYILLAPKAIALEVTNFSSRKCQPLPSDQ